MLKTTIDRNSPIPIYYQIETDLKKRIIRREWEKNQQLPTEIELAKHYNVSRITLRQALAELEKDGVMTHAEVDGFYKEKINNLQSLLEQTRKSPPVIKPNAYSGSRLQNTRSSRSHFSIPCRRPLQNNQF